MMQMVRSALSVKTYRRRRVWPPPNLKESEEAKRLMSRKWQRPTSWYTTQSS
jgi:hypothetical protein